MLSSICSRAFADCPEQQAWADRCTNPDFRFEVRACPPGVIVGSARLETGAELPIELKRASERSFRRVGDTSIQPLGEYPNWNLEPRTSRDTLDAMVECVTRAGPPPLPEPEEKDSSRKTPRLLALGLLLLAVTLSLRLKLLTIAARKYALRDAVLLLGVAGAVAWLRWHLVPPATFHQNGQGPLWVLLALERSPNASIYGPGYAEVYGWLASRMSPETAIYAINSALFALMLPATFGIVRSAGLSRRLSWLVVAGLALDPLAARLAGGESYFATTSGLGVLACLAMVTAAQPRHELVGQRWWLLLLGTLAAALLIGQAARVHPVAWTPLALTGVAPLCLQGPLRRRATRAALIAAGIAGLVLATSMVEMAGVLTGELGKLWLPRVSFRTSLAAMGLALFPVLWGLAKLRRDAIVPALCASVVVAVALGNNPLRSASPLITHAVYWLYLPAALAVFAGWLVRLNLLGRTVSYACIVGLWFGWGWEYARSYLTLPTDAREIRAANAWKQELPDGSTVVYVYRVGQRVLFLPLYDEEHFHSSRLSAEMPTISRSPRLYYYRSSLCSVPDGKKLCEDVEARLELVKLREETLPAVASLPYLPLQGPVRVALFKAKLRDVAP
ncbi:MAG: hypothetical protein R3B89_11860 [Polyangiaceae bacterium]